MAIERAERNIPGRIGVADSRPHLQVIQGLSTTPYPTESWEDEPGLISTLNPKGLNSRVRSVAEIVNNQGISLDDKKSLLAYFLWHESGNQRAVINLFPGTTPVNFNRLILPVEEREDLIDAFDAVSLEVEARDLVARYVKPKPPRAPKIIVQLDTSSAEVVSQASEESNPKDDRLRVLELRKLGKTYLEISIETAIPLPRVQSIMRVLLVAGEISPKPNKVKKTEELIERCKRVEYLRNEKHLDNKQIAEEMRLPYYLIHDYVHILLSLGRISPLPSAFDVQVESKAIRERIVEMLSKDLGVTDQQMAEDIGISVEALKWHVTVVRSMGLIPKNRDVAMTEQKKEIFRQWLREELAENPNGQVAWTSFRRKKKIAISNKALTRFYEEISKEEPVPRRHRRRSQGKSKIKVVQ